MILRRVIDHVKTQNWTAIGIDFVIVVVGVFIGIQVANWNETLADKERGRIYTERLILDLKGDITGRQNMIAYYDAVLASAELTIALLQEPAPDSRALVVNAYRATEFSFYAQSRASWDEIISSGDASLLPPGALGSGLTEYFSYDVGRDILGNMEDSAYRHLVRSLLPHHVQDDIRAHCSDIRDEESYVIAFKESCDLQLSEEELESAAQILLSNPSVLPELRYQISIITSARANLDGDLTFLKNAIIRLEGLETSP